MITRLWQNFLESGNLIAIFAVFSAIAFTFGAATFDVVCGLIRYATGLGSHVAAKSFFLTTSLIGGSLGIVAMLVILWMFGQAWKGG